MKILKSLVAWLAIAMIAIIAPIAYASFYVVQGITYSVSSTVVPTDSTITLSSFTSNGVALTMSNFGSIGYGVLDPENNARIEDISFTGVTQNANGTATLTGVSRGLAFTSPYAASITNAHTHLVGSHFLLSDTGGFYSQFGLLNNSQTFSGIVNFSVSPTAPTPTTASQVATKGYSDALVAQGLATSTEYNFGGVWLATALQQASSTNLGVNTPLVLQAKNATSTYNAATAPLKVVVTQNDGKIDSNFIRTSDNFAWSGNNTHSGTETFSGNTTFSATTTIAANTAHPLFLNGATTTLPSANGIGFLLNDGSGNYSLSTTTLKTATGVITTNGTKSYTTALSFMPYQIRFSTMPISAPVGAACMGNGSWSYPTSNSNVGGTFNANGTSYGVNQDSNYSIWSNCGTNPTASTGTVTTASSTGFTIGFTKNTSDVYVLYTAIGY